MYEQHETGDPQLGKEKEDKMDKRTKELVVVGVVVIIAMIAGILTPYYGVSIKCIT